MPKSNTLIKICGLTSEEQALQVAQLGAHAIGIISVEESPRYISAEIKKNIFTTLERFYPKIERVSVVQNCPVDLIIKNFLGDPSETKVWKTSWKIIEDNKKKEVKNPIIQDSLILKISLEVKLTWLLILHENKKRITIQ